MRYRLIFPWYELNGILQVESDEKADKLVSTSDLEVDEGKGQPNPSLEKKMKANTAHRRTTVGQKKHQKIRYSAHLPPPDVCRFYSQFNSNLHCNDAR